MYQAYTFLAKKKNMYFNFVPTAMICCMWYIHTLKTQIFMTFLWGFNSPLNLDPSLPLPRWRISPIFAHHHASSPSLSLVIKSNNYFYLTDRTKPMWCNFTPKYQIWSQQNNFTLCRQAKRIRSRCTRLGTFYIFYKFIYWPNRIGWIQQNIYYANISMYDLLAFYNISLL